MKASLYDEYSKLYKKFRETHFLNTDGGYSCRFNINTFLYKVFSSLRHMTKWQFSLKNFRGCKYPKLEEVADLFHEANRGL